MTTSAPACFHTLTAYLVVRDAPAALDFYHRALGATETLRVKGPDDSVIHAEMIFGDSRLMLTEENETFRSPQHFSGTTVSLLMYVPDVDSAFDRAIAAGVKVLRPVQDQFWGDRAGTLEDPFGHVWTLATHKEDFSPEELQRRAAAAFCESHPSPA